MKNYSGFIWGLFFFIGFSSCKKDISQAEQQQSQHQQQDVAIQRNVVSFKSIETYIQFAGKKDKSQLYNSIDKSNLLSLAKLPAPAKPINSENIMGSVNVDEEGDSSLYPEFLQNILNQDSIVQIGNYYIKVDLVNERGLVLNASYFLEYQDLKNNNLSNTHIMTFDNDDYIFDVLNEIDKGTITYTEYLKQKASPSAVQVPILCFDKGAPKGEDKEYVYFGEAHPKYRMKCEVTYQKAIIYFRLFADQKTQRKKGFLWVRDCENVEIRMSTYWAWVQRCKKSSDNSKGFDYGFCQNTRVAYESAKGLRSYEMHAVAGGRFISDWLTNPTYPFTQSRELIIKYVR